MNSEDKLGKNFDITKPIEIKPAGDFVTPVKLTTEKDPIKEIGELQELAEKAFERSLETNYMKALDISMEQYSQTLESLNPPVSFTRRSTHVINDVKAYING